MANFMDNHSWEYLCLFLFMDGGFIHHSLGDKILSKGAFRNMVRGCPKAVLPLEIRVPQRSKMINDFRQSMREYRDKPEPKGSKRDWVMQWMKDKKMDLFTKEFQFSFCMGDSEDIFGESKTNEVIFVEEKKEKEIPFISTQSQEIDDFAFMNEYDDDDDDEMMRDVSETRGMHNIMDEDGLFLPPASPGSPEKPPVPTEAPPPPQTPAVSFENPSIPTEAPPPPQGPAGALGNQSVATEAPPPPQGSAGSLESHPIPTEAPPPQDAPAASGSRALPPPHSLSPFRTENSVSVPTTLPPPTNIPPPPKTPVIKKEINERDGDGDVEMKEKSSSPIANADENGNSTDSSVGEFGDFTLDFENNEWTLVGDRYEWDDVRIFVMKHCQCWLEKDVRPGSLRFGEGVFTVQKGSFKLEYNAGDDKEKPLNWRNVLLILNETIPEGDREMARIFLCLLIGQVRDEAEEFKKDMLQFHKKFTASMGKLDPTPHFEHLLQMERMRICRRLWLTISEVSWQFEATFGKGSMLSYFYAHFDEEFTSWWGDGESPYFQKNNRQVKEITDAFDSSKLPDFNPHISVINGEKRDYNLRMKKYAAFASGSLLGKRQTWDESSFLLIGSEEEEAEEKQMSGGVSGCLSLHPLSVYCLGQCTAQTHRLFCALHCLVRCQRLPYTIH